MKQAILAGLCAAVLSTGATAGGKGQPLTEEERAARMERMKSHLELTDEQVEEIRQIREQGGGREQVRAVLTEEQQARWKEQRKLHKKQGKSKQQGGVESTGN